MMLLKNTIACSALVLVLTLAAPAAGESVVPPGNSAATQYTETFPTVGGNAAVDSNSGIDGSGGDVDRKKAEKALGQRTVEALDSEGEEGRALAELAAGASESEADGGEGGEGRRSEAAGGRVGGGDSGGAQPQGSSAVGEVVSHGALTDSGGMGIVLPAVLFAALAWALWFGWRRAQRTRPTSA